MIYDHEKTKTTLYMAIADHKFSSTVGCLTKGKGEKSLSESNHQSR